jgi:mersacidin/lichenicidin family type 2 lantibiotic
MSQVDVVRAWRDPQYRRSLSAEQLECLPTHPAGRVQVDAKDLRTASGISAEFAPQTTAWFCTLYTYLARCCK